MPDVNISTGGGDATIGGDVAGRDRGVARVSDSSDYVREEIRDLKHRVGENESDMINVRTELAANRERSNFILAIIIVWPVLIGILVLIVSAYVH